MVSRGRPKKAGGALERVGFRVEAKMAGRMREAAGDEGLSAWLRGMVTDALGEANACVAPLSFTSKAVEVPVVEGSAGAEESDEAPKQGGAEESGGGALDADHPDHPSWP